MEWDNEEMKLAWQLIAETDVSVFLTGKAGTGKTTFLRRLREAMPKRMVVLAPTGVAAINAQGQTLHSFFQLPFGPNVPGAQTERKSYYKVGKEKKTLVAGEDYKVVGYTNNVKKGSMTVTIEGTGEETERGTFSGTKTFKVKIVAKNLDAKTE